MRAKNVSLMCTFSVFFFHLSWQMHFRGSTFSQKKNFKKCTAQWKSLRLFAPYRYVRYRTKCRRMVLISSNINLLHWQKLQQTLFFHLTGPVSFIYSEYQFITGNIGNTNEFPTIPSTRIDIPEKSRAIESQCRLLNVTRFQFVSHGPMNR